MQSILLLVLLLLPVSVYSQQAEPLREWYHINSGGQIAVRGPLSHLPNLVSPNGEHGTIMPVVTATQSHTPLWLHRYLMDTVTAYEWPWISRNIIQVDLDNNGVLDYFVTGAVVRGIQNGQPPEPDTVRWYQPWFLSVEPYTVMDVNDDGYPDIITNLASSNIGGSRLFSVLMGGPDLANLKHTLLQRRGSEYFIGLLNRRGEDGSFRVITLMYDTWQDTITGYRYYLRTSLVLSKMQVAMQQDSLHISLEVLDSLFLDTKASSFFYSESKTGVYHIQKTEKEYILATEYSYKDNSARIIALDVKDDKFISVGTAVTNNSNLHILDADINGDGYEDWVTRKGADMFFYAGQREGIDTVPFGKYTLPCTDQIDFIHAIGDVNNDGINDMAYALLPNSGVQGCFGIILGESRRTVGVSAPLAGYPTSYQMQQNYPNPVGSERRTLIPVEVTSPQSLTLEVWTLGGQLIGELFAGSLPEGRHELAVSLESYHLAAGLYVVRLRGEEGAIERAILLQ